MPRGRKRQATDDDMSFGFEPLPSAKRTYGSRPEAAATGGTLVRGKRGKGKPALKVSSEGAAGEVDRGR
jgi:hypothetical protein